MADIKFELSRLIEYSDDEIIKEIQRVASLLNTTPLTGEAFNKESKVDRTTINRRFGGWKEALELAGLGELYSGRSVTKNMKERNYANITDKELLDELRRVSEIVGRKDISSGDIKEHSSVYRDKFSIRFGSWEKAISLAGLECRVPGAARRMHSDQDLFTNLYDVWVYCGRQPHYEEMKNLPSKITSKNYINRFGTWRKALLAFIEYVNIDSKNVSAESEVEDCPPNKIVSSIEQSVLPVGKKQSEDRREIGLGLRFKILTRDQFKCVLCGNNPPACPGLVLHVDHILPWSKGGKTEFPNLRTLCADCNIGRGNRYSE